MAIVEKTISDAIYNFMQNQKETDGKKAQKKFADELASIIATAIKSATVTFPTGAIVVSGSAVTQTNLSPVSGAIIT